MAIERLGRWVLRLARVPPPPSLPEGTSGPVLLFRAAPAYYRYLQWRWVLAELLGVVGIGVGLLVLPLLARWGRFPYTGLLPLFETVGVVGFVLLMPVTYALLRLDYELRWYRVTDHSLLLREGVLSVREQTLTFANVQQVAVRQGPLQRLLGIADLEVRTAGGGDAKANADAHAHGGLHKGTLRGVDNAEELRTLILGHLRRARDSGLGDPDDAPSPGGAASQQLVHLQETATALLQEVRLLRQEATPPARVQREG